MWMQILENHAPRRISSKVSTSDAKDP